MWSCSHLASRSILELHMNISGVLPVHNGELFIENSLPGILSTLRQDDELIIINNGSSDLSGKLLKHWSSQDSRIKLITTKNPNLVEALNIGIQASENDWVARFDIDDMYKPERLSRQRESVTKKTVAVFSDYEFIKTNGETLGVIPSAIFPPAVSVSLVSSQRTPHPSVIFSKEAVESVGGYRNEDFPAEDLSLWLRLSRVGNLTSIPLPLLRYRLNQGSVSEKNRQVIKDKTRSLYESIGVHKVDITDAINSSEAILNSYEQYSQGEIRKILLIKELLSITIISKNRNENYSKRVKSIIQDFIPKTIFKTQEYHAYYDFLMMRYQRTKYRSKIKNE